MSRRNAIDITGVTLVVSHAPWSLPRIVRRINFNWDRWAPYDGQAHRLAPQDNQVRWWTPHDDHARWWHHMTTRHIGGHHMTARLTSLKELMTA